MSLALINSWSHEVVFRLNGRRVCLTPETVPNMVNMTLIEYLRSTSVGLTGTKLVCGEGACGACSVMVSRYDPMAKRVVHRAVNSCLYPLCACDGCSVVTVEGLTANSPGHVHRIQKTIAEAHGSQCGFCTPGFVMTLCAYLAEHPTATPEEIELSLDGNLCRCTGYRPILEAARSLARTAAPTVLGACDGKGGCGCGGHGAAAAAHDALALEDCAKLAIIDGEMRSRPPVAIESRWFAPQTLADFLALKTCFPDALIVVGNSEVGVDMRMKNIKPSHFIYAGCVPELNRIEMTPEGVVVGAAVPLTDIAEFFEAQKKTLPAEKCGVFDAICKQLKQFACRQIRNTACIGGNLTTASPTSDLNPVLLATNAAINVCSSASGMKVVPINSWFVGYRKVALAADQIVVSVCLKFTAADEVVNAYKVSRRREDDIHISSCCFDVTLHEDASAKFPEASASTLVAHIPSKTDKKPAVVSSFSAAFGSMAIKTSSVPSVTEFLKGKVWDSSLLSGVFAALDKDLPLTANAPGGVVDFRRCMTKSLFYKFFIDVCDKVYGHDSIPAEEKCILQEFERHQTKGVQTYETKQLSDVDSVNCSPIHMSALRQATGEALFCDDVPAKANELYGCLITSNKAHAKILKINTERAKAAPGVVGVYTAKDIPGKNFVGEQLPGEELWASEIVPCAGFPLGIVVADTHQHAKDAADLVAVEYQDLKPILTIKEAIEAKSFQSPTFEICRGNLEEGFKNAKHIIEGEVVVEGQDHFYLEPMSSIATPGECGEMDILTSTQNPTLTQMNASKVLGVPAHLVTAHVKRVGGGFGGKETRAVPIACAAAVPAAILKRPVRLVLERQIDFANHGTRHPFYGKYKMGFNDDGKIVAYDVELFANGGHSLDLSIAILHRALFHVDNAYYVPNIRCRGTVCKTNRPSNTAFRGFGGPQGMIVIESAMERMAQILHKEPAELRFLNMYTEGQRTHYEKKVECCNLQRCWNELMDTSSYKARKEEDAKFNQHNKWKKRGISCIPVKFGLSFTHAPLNQAGSLVHVYEDGTVTVSQGACEIGQGVFTKMAQIAAQELRIPLSLVRVAETSTATVANTSATAASVQADINGQAVYDACHQIRKRLDDFIARNPQEYGKLSWKDLIAKARFNRVDLSAHGYFEAEYGYDWVKHVGRVFAYYTYGAACSEVEVDVLTGEYRIIRSDIVMDLGKSINPAIDVGQVEGAFVQGYGWSTVEQFLVFAQNGNMYTKGPGTYKVPGPGDVPADFHVTLLKDAEHPFAIHSSKGVGEPPFFLGTSVFFAIKEAILSARADNGLHGYFQMSIPASVDRIRLACHDAFTAPIKNEPGCWIEEYPVLEVHDQ